MSSDRGRLNFLSRCRKYILLWTFFMIKAMFEVHPRSWERVDPRNLRVFTVETVLLRMVMGFWGTSPEVHSVQLQVVDYGSTCHYIHYMDRYSPHVSLAYWERLLASETIGRRGKDGKDSLNAVALMLGGFVTIPSVWWHGIFYVKVTLLFSQYG